MQHVIAAVAAALSITPGIAARIVEENGETLRARDIPAEVGAMGYATANGSHLMLAGADHSPICDLRISFGALAAIEEERGVVETAAETPMTPRERQVAQALLTAMAASDGSAMLGHDGRWLAVDGHFLMADLVRAVVAKADETRADSIA